MPSTRAVGPLDGRRTVTRCVHCAKRRIKCDSRLPCKQCTARNIPCEPQRRSGNTVVVFVQGMQSEVTVGKRAILNEDNVKSKTSACFLRSNPTDLNALYLSQFVAFFQKTALTANFPAMMPEILSLLPTSDVLHHAAAALGALEAARLDPGRLPSGLTAPRMAAVGSYQTSLAALQSCLSEKNVAGRDDVLWTTVFLGLFELFSDHSGQSWIRHLSGTAKMLQLAGPSITMSPLRKGFFDLFRVLEASRALIYNEGTILSEEPWVGLQKELAAHNTHWEPLEGILSLMIETSAFSKRSYATMQNIPEKDRPRNTAATLIAAEGLRLQTELYTWHTEALLHLSQNTTDDYFSLSLVYYHALIIFLSGNFDHYTYWDNIPSPILSRVEVFEHVADIIDIAEQLLYRSKLPNVMLFFPLGVAGARARVNDHRARIVGLMNSLISDGSVVADRVKCKMIERWEEEDGRVLLLE